MELLTPLEAAEFLTVTPTTLACWRIRGRRNAPPFIKVGRMIRYDKSALEQWIKSRTYNSVFEYKYQRREELLNKWKLAQSPT